MGKVYFCSLAIAFLFFELSYVEAKLTKDQIKSMTKSMANSCANKVGLSQELQEAHARGEFPEDETLMCYLHCIASMGNMMDKNNKFDTTTVTRQITLLVEEETAVRMLDAFTTCVNQMTATEPCRLVYDYSKCYYNLDSEVYMF